MQFFPNYRITMTAHIAYIKSKLSVSLQDLVELKAVFKEDAGLDLNVSKTSILPKGVTQQVAFDVAQGIITVSPALTHLSADLALASFFCTDFDWQVCR
jgi:hypothetical protein